MTVGPTSDAEYEQILGEGGRRAEIYRALRDLRDRYADLIRERFPDIPRRVSGYSLDELLPENDRSEEHTSELQSLMRISYAVFCLKNKKHKHEQHTI